MNKFMTVLVGVLALAACNANETAPDVKKKPDPAYYTDWDRAIRADVDMQNMFVRTPRRIEKPLDMYMAMALALKYNYTRRMISYEESLIRAGQSSFNKLPELISNAGYVDIKDLSETSADLKAAWNILDVSILYYQNADNNLKANVAFEQSHKVIHNILQETRVLYWKTLTAQRLLPVVDNMIEYMTLKVDAINAEEKELAQKGENMSRKQLIEKRKYVESIEKLSDLKRNMETSEVRLASLMGFHPSTQYKLVGPEYGNFALPQMKANLSQLEWLALTNRPELRVHDNFVNADDLQLVIKEYNSGKNGTSYTNNPSYYNKMWTKNARDMGRAVFEDVKNLSEKDLTTLRRQRMTNLILSQVYVSWARYMSATEDYQIRMEMASTSENIAEDFSIEDGSKNQKSQLEASRAIEDETKAFLSYVDLQDSLGNLYATIGLDAIPYYMLEEKPSKIAVYLRKTLEKWYKGEFLPDNRPYLMEIPTKRPPVNLTTEEVEDLIVETGEKIDYTLSESAFSGITWKGKMTTRAGMVDDSPLPKWLSYNPETMQFTGRALPTNGGEYNIKVYATDDAENLGYIVFKIIVQEVYVPSLRVKGVNSHSKAIVLQRCKGAQCNDLARGNNIGKSVQARPIR